MRAILAAAYELSPSAVGRDAAALATWALPLDELVARLCRVHRWEVAMSVIYVGALRSALLDRAGPSPWDDD